MVWLILEAILAGAILTGIIWWTIPKRKRKKNDE